MATIERDFSTVETERESHTVNHWLQRRLWLNWETWVYLVIFVLAVFTRFYLLGDRVMSHDESLHTKFSWDLYSSGIFQHTPLMHGPVLFHVTALSYYLFGDNDFTARIYPAVLGVLMVMFPLLFRRWLGRWGAILASVMFLVSPLILYYNRYIREDTPSIFYTLVMVYCTFMYLNGPKHLRRKARWLYIFSAALFGSMATKEVSFIYIAVFGSFLTLYWLVRLRQSDIRWPENRFVNGLLYLVSFSWLIDLGKVIFRVSGKSLLYYGAMTILTGAMAAVGMYVVLSIAPLETALPLGAGSVEFASLLKWTLALIVAIIVIVLGTLFWQFRGSPARKPWVDAVLMLALAVVVASLLIVIEERSHVAADASQPSAPVVPGEEGEALVTAGYRALPLYGFWGVSIIIAAGLIYMKQAGYWRRLYRFPEFDILLVMGSLVLPWLTPFVMKWMNANPTSLESLAAAVQASIPIQFDLTSFAAKLFLAALPVLPALLIGVVAGLMWNPRRWLISAAVFYFLFVFFFTTVFTNIWGIGTGMIGSLGYWLEQQAVRRGNQPQYYYLTLIMPFYEFLPVIGGTLAMLAGFGTLWRYRRKRLEAEVESAPEVLQESGLRLPDGEVGELGEMLADAKPKRRPAEPEPVREVPFLLFVSWWAVFNLIAYTLAGEKMPWLGTHLTTPMIFMAAWYFGRFFDRIQVVAFWKRNWLYAALIPVLIVALAQMAAPFLFATGLSGLETAQLTGTFQWFAGIVIAGGALYGIWRLAERGGWSQARVMVGVMAFVFLGLLTFRSAWMAAFINYDLATEYLVYAHGAPSNKRVTEQLQDLSERITDGMNLRFAYDFKISWPGAWYFRNFKSATYLGETPSPRSVDEAVVVIVGDENRAAVEAMLEDRYFRFDYIRLWWPMQDYFGLTPQRVINTFDFSPDNPTAAQIRQGIWDIWWDRDYTTYGFAIGRDFDVTRWPVADRMYVFVRKDIAAQVWSLGIGEGTAINTVTAVEPNVCNEQWKPIPADVLYRITDGTTLPLNHARQVALSDDGLLYTTEEFGHRVAVFNLDGSLAFTFGSQGSEPGQFERPNGIAIGPSGNIYVADTWNFRVQVFTPQGEYITGWGARGEFGAAARPEPFDGLWGPRAIAVDNQERVYIADTGNKRIRVYTANGQYIRDIGSGGSGNGQLDEPTGLAISPDGLLYVADTWNRRISVFTLDGIPATNYLATDGTLVNSFRVRAWYDDQGNRPYLALDNERGLLYVTDPDAGRVLVYDTGGNCVGSFGQLGRDSLDLTQFASVGGITVGPDGKVYVADAGGARLGQYEPFLPEAPAPSGAEATVEVIAPLETDEFTAEVFDPSGITEEVTPETTPEAAG